MSVTARSLKKDISVVSNDRGVLAYILSYSPCPLPQDLFLNTLFCLHPLRVWIFRVFVYTRIVYSCNFTANVANSWSCS